MDRLSMIDFSILYRGLLVSAANLVLDSCLPDRAPRGLPVRGCRLQPLTTVSTVLWPFDPDEA